MTGRTGYTTLIQQVAAQYVVMADVFEALVVVESGGDPNAFKYEPAFFEHYVRRNPGARGYKYGPLAACSYGLAQIMLETALEIGFNDQPETLFIPRVGLAFGAKYLASLITWADGDVERGLSAYNGGRRAAMTRPFRNAEYVDKVLAHMGAA